MDDPRLRITSMYTGAYNVVKVVLTYEINHR